MNKPSGNMTHHPNNDDNSAPSEYCRLVLELLAHFERKYQALAGNKNDEKEYRYTALILEEDVREILGLSASALKEAVRLGILVPSHPGLFKVRQYAAVDVFKVFFEGRALLKAARAGVETVEFKNKRAKSKRLNEEGT